MNHIELKATEHKVHAVTVFQASRAEVIRLFDVNLQSGQNEIEISHLPSVLDQDSIRVDGIGHKAIIADVVYHAPDRNAVDKVTEQAIKELRSTKSILRNQLDTYKGQGSILETYSRTVNTKEMTKEQLADFLEFYEEKRKTIDEKATEWQGKVDKVDEEIQEKKTKMHANEDVKKRGVRTTVVVKAKSDGPAKLSLSYLVSNAQWAPLYDLRAELDSQEAPISLQYRATITQNTGEDWKDVELTLSTASTQSRDSIPWLYPQTITVPEEEAHEYQSRGVRSSSPLYDRRYSPVDRYDPDEYDRGIRRSRSPHPVTVRVPAEAHRRRSRSPRTIIISETRRSRSRSRSHSPPRTRLYRESPSRRPVRLGIQSPPHQPRRPMSPPRFNIVSLTATEGVISTYYEVEGLSTILTGTDTNKQEHKVTIAILDLPAELQWITIPKQVQATFLQAKVKNTSSYFLLPGRANIFLDDNFVIKSYIYHVSPNESFNCSLGVDPQVKVTYHPRSRKTKSQGGLLSAATSTTSSYQKITVKNTRGRILPRLLVRDQIPVSSDQRLKVILTDPAVLDFPGRTGTIGANSSVKPKEHTIARGVVVRWMVNEDDLTDEDKIPGADGAREGIVEWVCEIPSGQSIDLTLAYDVTAPSSLYWQ